MHETAPTISPNEQLSPRQTAIEESLHKIRNPFEYAATDQNGNTIGVHDVAAERYAIAANETVGNDSEGEVWTAQKIRQELLRRPKFREMLDSLAANSPTLQELDESLLVAATPTTGGNEAAEHESGSYEKVEKLQKLAEAEKAQVVESARKGSVFVCKLAPTLEALRDLYPDDRILTERFDAFVRQIDKLARQKEENGEQDPLLAVHYATQDAYKTFLSNAERNAFIRASENEKRRQERFIKEMGGALGGSSMTHPPEYLFGALYDQIKQ